MDLRPREGMGLMFKTAAALIASLCMTGALWAWTSSQFNRSSRDTTTRIEHVQAHQGDSLRTMICYFEERTTKSKQLNSEQKLQGIRTLETALRKARLQPCNITQ